VPDPATNNAFTLYIAIPADYIAQLQSVGAALTEQPRWLLHNGGGIPWRLAVAPLVLLAAQAPLRKAIPSRGLRIALALFLPLLLAIAGGFFRPTPPGRVVTARVGLIVGRPGMPAAATDGTGSVVIAPLLFRPGPEDDRGHYILAQEAYLEGDPDLVARQLDTLTGHWRPRDAYTRDRIGILRDYARANGRHIVGPVQALGSDWHPELRRLSTLVLLMVAAIFVLSAFAVDVSGRRRTIAADRLRRRLGGATAGTTQMSATAAAVSFGRKAA
jgi:hypothetical protein